ncbi:hypothetical protein Hypma_004778 [Hypsizygus marmoreus]|uniref:Fungal-type protein kinase domain-containing protein n=1 Tax=Hypsizygus marmoreus TaxID=39966 RepID=A0A369J6K1_HYPMA|nr:hypothetical protein Hypma_004778 [Hypsizygus marmoreus]
MYSGPGTEAKALGGALLTKARFLCYRDDPNPICSNKLYVVEDSSRPGQAATELATDGNIATISPALAYKNSTKHEPRNAPKCLPGHLRLRYIHNLSCSKPLSSFSSSKEMMVAVYDAYVAHHDAFRLCNILHRDIGVKNIIIKRDGRGALIDWDIAHEVVCKPPRQRSGTWQFMSTLALEFPNEPHTLQDELESFVLVALYLILRHLRHSEIVLGVAYAMDKIFDSITILEDGATLGGYGKRSVLSDGTWIGVDFTVTDNEPLTEWLYTVMEIVAQWHNYYFASRIEEARRANASRCRMQDSCVLRFEDLALKDHGSLERTWKEALARCDWPSDDKLVDHLLTS